MTITVGESFQRLSSGRKWYAYSGPIFGGAGVPALITMIDIPDTGLDDSYVRVIPYYGVPVVAAPGTALGIEITIDGIAITRSQADDILRLTKDFELFIPKQSRLLIESRNSFGNNTQERGVNVLGWYL